MRRRFVVLLAAVTASLASVAVEALILGDTESVSAVLQSAGVDSNSVLSAWSGVGSVSVSSGSRTQTFSGVLISPRHVLTAAHVAAGAAPGDITFNLNYGGNLTHRIPVAVIKVHPDFSGFNPRRPNDDLAVIRLARDVPEGIPIHPLYRRLLSRGELLTLVSYGSGGDGVSGATVSPDAAIKRVGYNRADVFAADDEGSGRIEVYHFDFDGPDPVTNRMGGLTLGGNLETGVAPGDSGSPAFVHEGGAWWLAGINTFHWKAPDGRSSVFGAGGGGMLLSGYSGWIDEVVNARDEEVPPREFDLLELLGAAGVACAVLFATLRGREKSA